jgi:hypothetical protein
MGARILAIHDLNMEIKMTEADPKTIYRIMDSKVDALAAIGEVLAQAQTSIAIFEESPVSMREREYGRPATIELLRQLMLGNRSRKIRIALHETNDIGSELPRLMTLMGDFSTQLFIQRTIGDARSAQDVMLIADDDAVWRKPVASHTRSIVTIHDAADAEPFINRFEEIWLLTEHAVSSRGTGL